MKTRIISLLLLVAMLAALCVPVAMADDDVKMYVKTQTGGTLNLREGPSSNTKCLAKIPYGDKVTLICAADAEWFEISWNGHFGYAYARYLSYTKPTSKPSGKATPQKTDEQKALSALNSELKSLTTVSEPFMVAARPSRASGWVNFRVGPNASTTRISTLRQGKELRVIGETKGWYQAVDPETGKTGFVSKNFVTVMPKVAIATTPAANAKEQLGVLNVNGKFALQCKLPEGYTTQVVNMMGTKVIASINPATAAQPVLYLSITFDEAYSDVARLNDLPEEQLAILEQSFHDMNEVAISYRETSHGTKLLVAREVGSDTDFVDILSIYQGYSIEFVMTPNPALGTQTLTEAQVQMCIDFLSDLDFVPVA